MPEAFFTPNSHFFAYFKPFGVVYWFPACHSANIYKINYNKIRMVIKLDVTLIHQNRAVMKNSQRSKEAKHWRLVIKKYDLLSEKRPLRRDEIDQRYLAQFNLNKLYESPVI